MPSPPNQDAGHVSEHSSRSLIGEPPNHWLYTPEPPTFDLTRPKGPHYRVPSPRSSILLKTTTKDVLIAPELAALVIIDMQNFFLSPALGRDPDGAGNKARETLLRVTIPAARKARIRVIWLNWGLDDADMSSMPPSVRRAFGFEAALDRAAQTKRTPAVDAHGVNQAAAELILREKTDQTRLPGHEELTENGKPKRLYKGLGSEIGPVKLADGTTVDGGRLLFADSWNANIPSDLRAEYEKGLGARLPDVWIHKNRMSGMWGSSTPATDFLQAEGIKTLFFAGVNTDQCVGGTLQDAFSRGYDCVLVKDACGTTSPEFASESWEFNSARTYGFVSDSQGLLDGVNRMVNAGTGSA